MPKLDVARWQHHPGFVSRLSGKDNGPYAELVLGDQAGLKQFGVHLEELPPGSGSSIRHWHEREDEFLFVVSGELVLVEEGETVLKAGDAAAWAAGTPVAHCLVNRSTAPAVFLVVGTRSPQEVVHYPDHDVVMHRDGTDRRFTRPDGTAVAL